MSDRPQSPNFDDLAQQLVAAIPENLRTLGQDLERNFKAMLQSAFERMDLVTREEFDLQSDVLKKTRGKLEELEQRLGELEKELTEG